MKLAVVTFTTGDRPGLLERCRESVNKNLPKNATHYIIQTKGLHRYADARINSLNLGEYYTSVDDDDIVVNDSISKCFEAIQEYKASVSFTDEALVDLEGNILSTRDGIRTYEKLRTNELWMMHHLVMFKVSDIQNDVTKISGAVQGTDTWFARSAMNTNGAIHVPIIGYHWTQHKNNLSKHAAYVALPEIAPCPYLGPVQQAKYVD